MLYSFAGPSLLGIRDLAEGCLEAWTSAFLVDLRFAQKFVVRLEKTYRFIVSFLGGCVHKWGQTCLKGLRFYPVVCFVLTSEEPVCKFLACLEQHACVRELSDSTAYWVCAYANNQHCVEEEITSNPRRTSFYRANRLRKVDLLTFFHFPFGSFGFSQRVTSR